MKLRLVSSESNTILTEIHFFTTTNIFKSFFRDIKFRNCLVYVVCLCTRRRNINIVTNRFLVDESTKILDKKVHYFVVSIYGYACDDDMETAIKKSREWIPANRILSAELLVYLIPGRNNETSYYIRHSMVPPCISKENNKTVKGTHLIARLQPPQVDEVF